jgi:hypothetical protein
VRAKWVALYRSLTPASALPAPTPA